MDTISLAAAARKRLSTENSGAAQTASAQRPTPSATPAPAPTDNTATISLATAAKKRLAAMPDTRLPTFKDNATAIAHDVYTAVSGIGDSFWGFADWVIKDDEFAEAYGVENKVGQFFDAQHQKHLDTVEENRRLGEKADPTVSAIGDYVVQPVVAAIPYAALAYLTGGGSVAASAGAGLASGAATASTAARVGTAVTSLLKNPSFWYSFIQTSGGSYNEAKDEGATETEASAYALLNGFAGSMIEMGGGIQQLPGTKQGVRQWIKSTLEEGGEEVLQGVTAQLVSKALYEQDKEWFSLTDTEAVVNPSRMAQEFGGGLVVGGIMGGGQIAVNKAVNSIRLYSAANQLGNQFLQGENGHTIDEALQIGLSNAKGTDAYAAALKLQERVNNRQEVSPYAVGRMVMESQIDAAQQAKAIEQMALQSAAQGRFPTDAAENIAAAAVKLNQPVVFGNAAEFQAGQAAYYDHNSRMVVLNPNANEQALQGAVLAHEMVHSAQATQQWTTLENTVRRMMGDAAWQTYQQEVASRYAARGVQLGDMQVRQEAIAHWVGENLFKQGFAQAVAKGDAKTGGILLRSLDKLRRAVGIKNSPSARDIAMLERLVMQAMENRTGTRSGEGVQYAIVVKADGKIYVQADRKVLTGTDSEAWKTQIDTFFDNVLLQNGTLTVESVEGDELTITKDETLWKGKDEYVLENGTRRRLRDGEYLVKLTALSHIDELAEASVVQRNKDGSRKIEPDKKNHPFAKDGFEYHTVYFQDFDGRYYRVTLSVGLADGISTVYNVGKIKETAAPEGSIISAIGSKAQGATVSDNNITDATDVVNTHSMQNGGGNTQSAYISEDQFVDRMGETPSVTASGGATSLGEGGYGNGGAVQVDEGAVLERAVRSQLQGRPTAQATDIDGIIAELGEETALRRMWSATQIDRPTGTVEINGQRVSADAYINEYENALPNDPAWLEKHIRELEDRRADAILQMEQEGTLDKYKRGRLPLDLQLFAAKRKLELYVPEGENGTKDRRFLWQRTRGLDANKAHEEELIEYISGRSETYNPISNEETLNDAKENFQRPGYGEGLIKRLVENDKRDLFNEVETAAVMLMINNARNDGDLERYGDLVQLLSRKGTAAGRAVQIFALQAKLTPEGTIRHAQKELRKATDHVHGEGTSDAIDMVADDVVKAVEEELRAEQTDNEVNVFDANTALTEKNKANDTLAYTLASNIDAIKDMDPVAVLTGTEFNDRKLPLSEQFANFFRSLGNMVIRNDLGDVELGKYGIKSTISHKPVNRARIVSVAAAPAVIEKGRQIAYHPDWKGRGYASYIFAAPVVVGKTTVYVGVVVDMNPDGKFYLSEMVTIDGNYARIEESPSGNAKNGVTDGAGQADKAGITARPEGLSEADSLSAETAEPTSNLKESVSQVKGGVKREKRPFDQERAQKILDKVIQDKIEDAPQLKKWLTRKDIRLELSRRIAKLVEDGALTNIAMQKTFREVLELPQLTTEDLGELIRLVNEMNAAEIGSAQQAEAEEAIYRLLGSKLPVTKMEWLQSWRKLAMLANPKTHIRNGVSNGAMYQVVGRADTAISTALQRIFLKPEARTAYLGWRFTDHGRAIRPVLDKAAEAATARMRLGQGKYDIGTAKLSRYKRPFKFELTNNINEINSDWLERADARTFRKAYTDALGQYMTARGLTEVTQEADEIAFKRAEEATFRASNIINDALMSLKRYANSSKKGHRWIGYITDIVIPFTKTPANIAVASIEHSPLGIAKATFELVQKMRGKSDVDAAAIINDFAKGITGTALLAIGVLLGHLGLFNTGFGKTEKERAADELAGLQENAFVFGDVSVSFDWLQPAASPLIVGASIGKRLAEDGLSLSAVFGAVMDGTDSLFEMTMLQSLYDILGGYDAGATATAASVAENVVSQSIPTLLGQAARAIDPVQRKTTADSEFMTIVNQVVAKIPGLTYLLDPELDVWGNEVYRTGKPGAGTAALNAVQQFALPSNVKVGTGRGDRVSAEILRLYRNQGSKAIPTAVSRDDAKDGELDYVEINRLLGQVNRTAVEDFINNQWPYDVMVDAGNGKQKKTTKYYRNMTDEERVRVLQRIYTNTKKTVAEPSEENSNSDSYFEEIFRRLK